MLCNVIGLCISRTHLFFFQMRAKTRKAPKNPADKVDGGILCSCGKLCGAISTYRRHLETVKSHSGMPAAEIDAAVEAAERKYLGGSADRFEVPRDCSVIGCKTRFWVKSSFYNHMENTHDLDQAAANNLPIKVSDHLPLPGKLCPKCDGTKRFTRRSHLLKHLTSNIHGMNNSEAMGVIDDPVVLPSSAEDELSAASAENELPEASCDEPMVTCSADNELPEASVSCNQQSAAQKFGYLDVNCEQYICPLCPPELKIRHRRYIDAHLRKAHEYSPEDLESVKTQLDSNTTTVGGDMLLSRLGVPLAIPPSHQELVSQYLAAGTVPANQSLVREEHGPAAIAVTHQPTVPIERGDRCGCPLCDKSFTRKKSCEKHLKTVHKLSPVDIETLKLQLNNVQTPCPSCGQLISNSKLSAHKRVCKGMKGAPMAQPEPATAPVAPSAFETQGKLFLPKFHSYLNTHVKSEGTRRQYMAKGEKLVYFFESTVPGFLMDRLLFVADTGFDLFPSLDSYLTSSEFTDADKRVAILSYKHMSRFLVSEFERCYGADSNFTVQEKDSWISLTQSKRRMFDGELTRLTKSAKVVTAANTRKKIQSKIDLTHNPDQLKKVVKAVLDLPYLAQLKLDMINLSDKEVKSTYSEIVLRYALTLELLLSSGGKRPATISNIKNKELAAAGELDDGSYVVEVANHKLELLGASQIIFCREGLFEAVVRYQSLFKYPENKDRKLFATENGSLMGGSFDLKHSIEWVKREFEEELLKVVTREELDTFTAKSNRRGFSNWGYSHEDPTINRDTVEAQDHSAAIDTSNYHVKSGDRTSRVTRTILNDVVGASCSLPPMSRSEAVPSGPSKANKGYFDPSEKLLLLRALGKSDGNGSFGKTDVFPSNERVNRALILVEGFSTVYDKALLKTKGKRSLANNLIWQSIRLPELKGSKAAKNPKAKPPKPSKKSKYSKPSKQTVSEDDDSPSDGEISLHDSSEDELPEELRKRKLNNLPRDSVTRKKKKFSVAESDSDFSDRDSVTTKKKKFSVAESESDFSDFFETQ